MKVFLGGPKRLEKLPKAAEDSIRKCMKSGDDLLVGDCCGADDLIQRFLWRYNYSAVNVYASNGEARYNAVFPVIAVPAPTRRLFPYLFYQAKDQAMADEADKGLFIWDGGSKGTFVNMFTLLLQEKPVTVITTKDKKVHQLTKIDDLDALLPPAKQDWLPPTENYPFEIVSFVIEWFMPSSEMQEHLKNDPPSRSELLKLILGAPVTLQSKAEVMEILAKKEDILHDVLWDVKNDRRLAGPAFSLDLFMRQSASKYYRDITAALRSLQLQPGEILYKKEVWYDDDIMNENEHGDAPFQSLDAALSDIRNQIKEEEWDAETLNWTVLEKWTPRSDGTFSHPYSYVLIKDKPIYFEQKRWNPELQYWESNIRGYPTGTDLNFSVPFHIGDIVTLDCRPFAPVKHAVILETGNDCCGLRGLLSETDGLWHNVALKHGHGWDAAAGYCPMLSSLYRMSRYDGELPEEEKTMKMVQEYLRQDPERGRRMDYAFFEITEKELIEYMRSER